MRWLAMLRHDKRRDDVCDGSRNHAGHHKEEYPDDTEKHRVNVKIFSQPTKYPGKHTILFAAVESFHICIQSPNAGVVKRLVSAGKPSVYFVQTKWR